MTRLYMLLSAASRLGWQVMDLPPEAQATILRFEQTMREEESRRHCELIEALVGRVV